MMVQTRALICILLLALLSVPSFSFSLLRGITVKSVSSLRDVDLGDLLAKQTDDTMVVLGTYAADFNAIEYAQRLRFYLPELKEKGIKKVAFVLNAEPSAAQLLAQLTDLPTDIELYSDPLGEAGKKFNCSRGWRPDDLSNPYVKLFGMLFGLGAWATLPAVIGGYIGNPFSAQRWIESAMAQGQDVKRWPDTALEIERGVDDKINIKVNKFKLLPVVGEWKRRPLELATLRLQNMLGISLKHWNELKPSDSALENGVLTQLGGCFVYQPTTDSLKVQWRDEGICHVANFEWILAKLNK